MLQHHLLSVDGFDTLDWDIEAIGPKERLHAKSADLGFDVVGKDGDKTLSCPLNYTGTRHLTHTYQLFVENTTALSSNPILGPNGEDLDLVIDTIGGMMQEPPDGDGPGESELRFGHRSPRSS